MHLSAFAFEISPKYILAEISIRAHFKCTKNVGRILCPNALAFCSVYAFENVVFYIWTKAALSPPWTLATSICHSHLSHLSILPFSISFLWSGSFLHEPFPLLSRKWPLTRFDAIQLSFCLRVSNSLLNSLGLKPSPPNLCYLHPP